MKYLCLLAIAVGVAVASQQDADAVREYMTNTNRSPKKQEYNVWDMIMIRGQDGQLRPWSSLSAPQATNNNVCENCQTVARFIGQALKDGEQVTKFKTVLEMLCNYLSDEERATCMNIVTNLPVAIHFAEKVVANPHEFCEEIDLCGATNVPRVVRSMVAYAAARTVSRTAANDVVCDECLFAARELKSIVEEKETETEVLQTVESLCSYLGGQTATECKSLVDQYFPLAWSEVVALLSDSRGFCTDLGFCNGAKARLRPNNMYRLMPAAVRVVGEQAIRSQESPVRSTPRLDAARAFIDHVSTSNGMGAGCVLCKIGLTGVVDYFKMNPKALKDVSTMLTPKVCGMLPKAYGPDCLDFLELYLHPVMQMTLDQVKPNEWCDKLKMCKSDDIERINSLSAPQRSAVVCEACTIVAEFTQHELNDKDVQDDITHALEQVCSDLPHDLVEDCKSFVDNYAPSIFQTAAQELNPMTVCPALHLCSASRNALGVKAIKPEAEV